MKITEGKLKGLEAVSDSRGIIRAAAMDQRGSLMKSIAKERGVDSKAITREMMEEFKAAVSRVLTPYASAILLDPEYGLSAAKARSKKAGLLLAYESSGYDNTRPGRIPDLLDTWTVRRLKDAGADAVKVLIYYTPFESKEVNEIKHCFVERIGAECADQDIPYFLEFVGYDPAGGDVNTLDFARKKPEVVAKSMQEFSKPQYQVDVLKVEIPVNMKFSEGAESFKGEKAYTKKEALEHFRKTAKLASKPFIYLSAGVSDDEFRESLEWAGEAGVVYNGVLCGRATWKEGIPVYAKKGVKALEDWLKDRGVQNIQSLNKVLDGGAKPWYSVYGGKGKIETASRKLQPVSA